VYYNDFTTPTYGPSPYGGYNTSGYTYNSNICAKTVGTKYFCSNSPVTFYAADSVYNNNWNYGSAAASGIMGMGKNSPIWEIVGGPPTKEFDVYMSNYNDWTFADSTWTPVTTQSVIDIGTFSSDYTQADAHTTFAPEMLGSYLIGLETFGFGKTDTIQ
jgi:hypothetical protein